MRTNRPPINGKAIQAARMRKGMTQEEVQQACTDRGIPVWNLSRLENGKTKWPAPSAIAVLAEVLDLEVDNLFLFTANPPKANRKAA